MATQAERREATRTAVIAAARTLFGNKGFALTTVDEIAAMAQVAKGGLYHHFPNKDAIFEAVFEATSEVIAEHVTAAARQARDPLDGICTGTEAYFDICSQEPVGRIILRDGPAVLGWRRWREIDSRHFGSKMPAALKAAMRAGLIDEQPLEPLSGLLLGAVTEAAIACSESPSPSDTGNQYITALKRILSGLRRGQRSLS